MNESGIERWNGETALAGGLDDEYRKELGLGTHLSQDLVLAIEKWKVGGSKGMGRKLRSSATIFILSETESTVSPHSFSQINLFFYNT